MTEVLSQEPQGKAKIVCTLGPSTNTVEMLVSLIRAGMDVVRLNFSHGTHEDHLTTIQNVHEAVKRTGALLTVLQDLQGPKIRIGDLRTPFVELRQGERFTITTDPLVGGPQRVSTTYANITGDVRSGDKILLDDGKLRLRVVEVKGNDVVCEVMVGGKLSAHKGINLPGVAVSAPSFTEKDIQDLEFGLKHDIDYVALSFVRTADDIKELRKVIISRVEKGRFLPIIAKIEKPQAVANIDQIIAEADGIMIARGDLGVELPPEDVPILQKMIVKKCNEAGKPVIIATQMLESMINSPTPTRAEASDVANAVVDGGDAVMLSGETSVGKYPLEAVHIMDRIIKKVESEHVGEVHILDRAHGEIESKLDALGRAACVLAEQMSAAAIVTVTHSGQTAKVISHYRPRPRIIAITDRPKILRRLNLFWGVRGVVIDELAGDSDKALQSIQEKLVSTGLLKRGEYMVILAGQPLLARGSTNFIKVEKVI
jgi:pyruvate kinase